MIKVFTHNCMGDHLICYGFIKEFCEWHGEILLATKDDPLQYKNIERLFSSLKNVTLDTQYREDYDIIISSQWWFDQVKHWYQYPMPDTPFYLGEEMIFDRFWYKLAQVPFNKKWDNFYLERDTEKEKEVYYDILGLKDNQEFTFIHEDAYNKDENRTISRDYIDKNIRLVNITDYPEISILDTAYTIERAKEAHVINSSFRTFIDLMGINNNNLYYHKYSRANPAEQVAVKLNWKTIEKRNE